MTANHALPGIASISVRSPADSKPFSMRFCVSLATAFSRSLRFLKSQCAVARFANARRQLPHRRVNRVEAD